MATPGLITGKNLVIASMQSSVGDYRTIFIESESLPEFRPNGGDLQSGDNWYNSNSNTFSVYTSNGWVTVGGLGILQDIQSKQNQLDELYGTLEANINALKAQYLILANRITDTETNTERNTNDISNLKSFTLFLDGKITGLITDLESLEATVNVLEGHTHVVIE